MGSKKAPYRFRTGWVLWLLGTTDFTGAIGPLLYGTIVAWNMVNNMHMVNKVIIMKIVDVAYVMSMVNVVQAVHVVKIVEIREKVNITKSMIR